jgi:hypothetical protein
MPCPAKHFDRSVDSMTPGNFLAEYTWNGSVKLEARTGILPLLTGSALPASGPMSMKLSLSLCLVG